MSNTLPKFSHTWKKPPLRDGLCFALISRGACLNTVSLLGTRSEIRSRRELTVIYTVTQTTAESLQLGTGALKRRIVLF